MWCDPVTKRLQATTAFSFYANITKRYRRIKNIILILVMTRRYKNIKVFGFVRIIMFYVLLYWMVNENTLFVSNERNY